MKKVFLFLQCLIIFVAWSCVSETETVEDYTGIGGRWMILSVDGKTLDYEAYIDIGTVSNRATSENFPGKGAFGSYQCSTTGIKNCPKDFSDVIVFMDGHFEELQWYTMTYPDMSGKKSTVKWRRLNGKTWEYIDGSEQTLVVQKQK